MLAEAPLSIHATCVTYGGIGILLRGASGSGKSSLALRLIEAGATLVADDRGYMRRENNTLHASCTPPLVGRLELRGLGLVPVVVSECNLDQNRDANPFQVV